MLICWQLDVRLTTWLLRYVLQQYIAQEPPYIISATIKLSVLNHMLQSVATQR
jgi:hypothetical protein